MKTYTGQGCADVFDKDALQQIKSWAESAAIVCKGEAQEEFRTLRKVNHDLISDQTTFEQLASILGEIMATKE